LAATGHFLANTVTKLELLARDQIIGNATGFFLKGETGWTIITNWHVLAGRDVANGQPRHQSGAVPDQCRFHTCTIPGEQLVWVAHSVNLGDPLAGTASWFEHPTEGQAIDVGILPINATSVGHAKNLLDPSGHDSNMFIDLGAELFLPGYPLGLTAAGKMAIWKRASLASSLEFGEGMNRFFMLILRLEKECLGPLA
jgi:hypothetical protein